MTRPVAVLIHVPDVAEGLIWYQRAFPNAKAVYLANFDFTVLRLGDVDLEIVPADDKVSSGPAGTVVYWSVPNLKEAMTHFNHLGATVYRGPLKIEDGLGMCQVSDPFGNLIGLRGPYSSEK